jgi:hypothetical protein
MNTWNQIKEKLLPPPDAKWLVWHLVPFSFLFLSIYLAMPRWTEFHKEAIFFAALLQIILVAFNKRGLFFLGLLGYTAFVSYLLFLEPSLNRIWNSGWLMTLYISLFTCYQINLELSGIFESSALKEKDLQRDVDLWKSRFETLHEKIVSDKEVVDQEIGKYENLIELKQKEADSLRVLISISHKETRRLEETLFHLEKTNQDLHTQQEALRQRQTINESLQSKKASKQPISLKDLITKG